ncbi:hypothetical protein [Chryseobacterium paludis]|uniref:hypothetical protein n=1 Tax=Chryseobacterium paludis TaxID=2956784 RepID=UPI0021C0EAA6|nr:hypothetical protein [Chryseobacterium paludis]
MAKHIVEEWQKAFPDLSTHEKNKFYKIIGPLLVGIELKKLPMSDHYRPYFVLYGLWPNRNGNDLKASLVGPLLLYEFLDEKGFQYDLTYDPNLIPVAVSNIKNQILIPLQGDVKTETILNLVDIVSKRPPLSHAPGSFLYAALQENLFNVLLYVNKFGAKDLLNKIAEHEWDENHFKLAGRDVYLWLASLRDRIKNRNEFLEAIDVNRNDKKLEKLPFSNLIE